MKERAAFGAASGSKVGRFDRGPRRHLAPGNETAAPFVATFLTSLTGNSIALGFYLMGEAVIAFAALPFTTETASRILRHEAVDANVPVLAREKVRTG